MTKRLTCSILFFMALATFLPAQVIVFPFQTSGQNHASLQWLGKAVAFYLLTAHELNGQEVMAEERVQGILNQNHVLFPFAMSKATAIGLAQESGAKMLVWGRILYEPGDSAKMTLYLFTIDLANTVQKEVPPITGKWSDLFSLLQEAYRQLCSLQGIATASLSYPAFAPSLSDFEKLVKSLLLVDPAKKVELLAPLAAAADASDFVLWETAKAQVSRREWLLAEALLQRISAHPFFGRGREFLLALVALGQGRYDSAQERFEGLRRDGSFPSETLCNLGVIEFKRSRAAAAEMLFRESLKAEPDPRVWANIVNLLDSIGEGGAAFAELRQALVAYPDDESLLGQFFGHLEEHPQGEQLLSLFREYISNFPWTGEAPAFEPLFKNPFQPSPRSPLPADVQNFYIEARNLFLENDSKGALDQVNQALEANPFVSDSFHLLGMIHLKAKEYTRAETAAWAALLLRESEENTLLLLRVLNAAGQKERAQEVLEAARKKYPSSKEWQNQKNP